MAQSQTEGETNASEYDYDADTTISEEKAQSFAESALGNIREHLTRNLGTARGMGDADDDSVGEVLDPDNVEHIQVRARPLENPKITVWLKDAPMWANDAWRDYIYPEGLNAYNGKVTTSFDVRPF